MNRRKFNIKSLITIFKKKTFKNLFFKNLVYLFAIITIPLMSLIIFIDFYYVNSVKQEKYSEIKENLTQITTELGNEINQIKNASYSLLYDKQVKRLSNYQSFEINNEFLKTINEIKTKLKVYKASSFLISNIGIIYLGPQYNINYDTSYSIFNFEYRKSDSFYVNNVNESIEKDIEYRVFGSDNGIVSICLLDKDEGNKGAIYTQLSFTEINKWLQKYTKSSLDNYYLIDNEKDIIYSLKNMSDSSYEEFSENLRSFSDPHESINHIDIGGNHYIMARQAVPDTDMEQIIMIDASPYLKMKNTALTFTIISLFIVILLSLFATSYITWSFHQPIDVIVNLLKNPTAKAVTDYDASYMHLDELGIISTLINETRFKEAMLKDELESKKTVLNEIQKKLLQAQINPHFINNSLETINWKAIDLLGEDNKVSDLLNSFSILMRRSFRNLDNLISVSSEIEHAKLYMRFQQMRYNNKFTVKWDIAPDTLNCFTVPIILQPLLENSIKYGIKPLRHNKGEIIISCQKKDENIEFVVSDNGKALLDEDYREIKKLLEKDVLATDNHIGLSNVHHRVKLAFGSKYGIILIKNSSEYFQKGLTVKITIPIVKNIPL